MLPSVIAIAGPTAVGKTDAALSLARHFQGEILLADSRQVYRGMDIGTNKHPEAWDMKQKSCLIDGVAYHGINLVDPDEPFTVQQWKRYAIETIEQIYARNHLPIIEGGTGLYLWTLLDNLDIPEISPDPTLRETIAKRIAEEGLEAIVAELLDRDPEAALFLDRQNPRRVIRAFEVTEKSGAPFSKQRRKGPKLFHDLRIGITRPLEQIDQRITQRTQELLAAGLEGEVQNLADQYGWEISAMSGIGYREWKEYFAGNRTAEEVANLIAAHTKQYARAQLKWFRRDPALHWVLSPEEMTHLTEDFLK